MEKDAGDSKAPSSGAAHGCRFPVVSEDDDIVGFFDRVESFFSATDTPEHKKVVSLIANIPPDFYAPLKKLCQPALPSTKSFAELKKLLCQHYIKKSNIRSERHKFFCAKQKQEESLSDFILRLRGLAEHCKFGGFVPDKLTGAAQIRELALEDALCDKFVSGVRSDYIQQQLIALNFDSFDKMCDYALNIEMSVLEERSIHKDARDYIHRVGTSARTRARSNTRFNSQKRGRSASGASGRDQKKCRRCGKFFHDPEKCPAKQWKCFICQKEGHTSLVCTRKERSGQEKAASERVQRVNCLRTEETAVAHTVTLPIEGTPTTMEVDTGAGPSLISHQQE
uniref:CCHC-type domain-containing protein n=1 Tax=Lutzomyia longipalpis TaxID=7200 RepID=A0A1B0CQW9_LUTLO